MSQSRRQLFEFNKEWIETSAVEAVKRRGDDYVILVMDLSDEHGFTLASGIVGKEAAEQRRNDCAEKGTSAVLTYDATIESVDGLFPDSTGWAGLKKATLPPRGFRVVIIGDGGVRFTMHQLPA